MNDIEEKLWGYIDGTCSPEEQQAISKLIVEDEAYSLKYRELLKLNQDFSSMELEEPSMAFTYNVMEHIRNENALVPLKAAINKKIIIGISVFFLATVIVMLALVFFNFDWGAQSKTVNLSINVKMPTISQSNTKSIVQAFVFFDVVLGLYLLDAYLRRKNIANKYDR
jgi:hypothetical protein